MRLLSVEVHLCLALALCAAALSGVAQARPEPAAGLQSQVYLPAVGKNGWPPPIPTSTATPTRTLTPTRTSTSTPTATAAATLTPTPVPLAPLSGLYGVTELDWSGLDSQVQIEQVCRLMQQAGVQWVRLHVAWDNCEPVQGQYQFGRVDALVAGLTHFGIRALPVIYGVPFWASSAPDDVKQQYGTGYPVWAYPPTDAGYLADFMNVLVERYDGDGDRDAPGSPRVDYWEIWSYPNMMGSFQPQPDGGLYVQLLRAARAATIAADPQAKIVLGCLSGNGVLMGWEQPSERYFLQAVYDNGGKDLFDVIMIQPLVHPQSGVPAMQAAVDDARQVTLNSGDGGKPIWAELGWSTAPNAWGNPTVSEEELAQWLIDVHSQLRGVDRLFWMDFRDRGTKLDAVDHHFGLVTYDLSRKPAYYAYQRFINEHPFRITISPNVWEGFEYVCGHPPFTVSFSVDILGAEGELRYSWDLDGDGSPDSTAMVPDRVVLTEPGVYTATLTVSDATGKVASAERRIVVIGNPDWPSWRYGVVAHLNFDSLYTNTTQIQQAIDMIADAGIQVIRMDFSWGGIQPGRTYSDWRLYDDLVARLAQRGLEFLSLVNGCPQWAAALPPDDPLWWAGPPRDPKDFGQFVFQLVSRYREHIHAWEIRNEPNFDLYFRGYDPVVYTTLLRQAYLATKYADPGAVVVFAGLALGPPAPPIDGISHTAFLEQAYAAGARGYFDALGFHPYTYPEDWIGPEVRLRGYLQVMRDVMAAHGDAKPIWITEIGWSNVYNPQEGCCTEQQVADWLETAFTILTSEGDLGPVIWYNFRDKGTNPEDPEHNLGLAKWDFVPKAAYHAYRQFINEHPTP